MSRQSSNKIDRAVASARPSVMHSREVYTGAELAPSSARPGAYDATRIPSLIHGQRVTREQQREDLRAPTPMPIAARPPTRVTVPADATAAPIVLAPPAAAAEPAVDVPVQVVRVSRMPVPTPPKTPAATADAPPYRPRPGSAPARVLAHMERTACGPLTYSRIQKLFGLAPNAINVLFKRAMQAGLVKRVHLEEHGQMRAAIALVGTPSAQPPSPQATFTLAKHPARPQPDAAQVLRMQTYLSAQLTEAAEHLGRLASTFAQAAAELEQALSPSHGQ